ncbi:hypothetical protein Bbelb_258850 [Branchiostoma belcheri]|nr:hypothetical protein Bbelb_258850 [Branchiostoma belcheri]
MAGSAAPSSFSTTKEPGAADPAMGGCLVIVSKGNNCVGRLVQGPPVRRRHYFFGGWGKLIDAGFGRGGSLPAEGVCWAAILVLISGPPQKQWRRHTNLRRRR